MNPEINLKNFGDAPSNTSTSANNNALVSPPRRVITRYLLPIILLAGFAAAGSYAFRDSFTQSVSVEITLPVPVSGGPDSKHNNVVKSSSPEVKAAPLFQAPGWIEPEPFPTMVSSLRMGTVSSINVLEGQSVTSGTVVARLVSEDARIAVDMASSTLALKRAKYQAAQNRWNNPTNLMESVATAVATQVKLQSEARRLTDMIELARVEASIGNQLTRGGYEASLDTLKKQTALSASRNELAETYAQMQLTSATLAAANERLALRIEDRESLDSSRAEVGEAEAALATANLQLSRSDVIAPIDGTIMRINASPGSMVSPEMTDGMLIASMYQPDSIQVRVDVPLSEAAKVKPGLPATIKVEAMPDVLFQGKLTNIVPEFDLQKNVLPVKVHINNPVAELRPEMIARVEFFPEQQTRAPVKITADSENNTQSTSTTEAASGSFLLPIDVVTGDGEQATVYVAGADGRAHQRDISISPSSETGYVLVSGGLQHSDKIIAVSDSSIVDGTPIKIKGMVNHGSH